MNRTDFLKSFATAAMLLPEGLARAAFGLNDADRLACEAFRIRLGRAMTAEVAGEERTLSLEGRPVVADAAAMDALLARVTGSSVHSFNGQMVRGYITSPQGHRLGLCGEMVWDRGAAVTVRSPSSVNLRIAKQVPGLSDALCRRLFAQGFDSTLILAPPGAGKTTLLRDMARWLSASMSVAVLDERHELAACRLGVPSFDLGRCDVLSGSPKAEGIELLIRSMAPRVIALDEITAPEDVRAVRQAAYCGCGFVTTAHGSDLRDLARRPVYQALMAEGIFKNIVTIKAEAGRRRYGIWQEGGEAGGQADRAGHDRGVVLGHGVFYEQEPAGAGAGPGQLYDGLAGH